MSIAFAFFKFSNTYNCLILKSDFDFYFQFSSKDFMQVYCKKKPMILKSYGVCILRIYASRNRKMIKSMFFLFFSYKKTLLLPACSDIAPFSHFFYLLCKKFFFKEWKDIMQLECENPIIH